MVVLERLTPDQRVAFVLHDGFAVPFPEIADVLGVSADSARQLASRARRSVAGADAPPRDPSHDETVGKLMAAMATGDLSAVVALLHPDVTFTGDSNRMAPTAARVIHGSDKVARFILGLAARYGPKLFEVGQMALVNGELGLYNERVDTDGEWPRAAAPHPGDHCPRRIGLRDMGCRESGQVHGVAAAVLGSPGHPARIPGAEALLGDAQRRVHAGPHVLHADLISQLEDPGIAEAVDADRRPARR